MAALPRLMSSLMRRTLGVAVVFGFTVVGGLRGDEPGSGEVTETPAPPLLPLGVPFQHMTGDELFALVDGERGVRRWMWADLLKRLDGLGLPWSTCIRRSAPHLSAPTYTAPR